MRPAIVSVAPIAAAVAGICASQGTGTGTLVLTASPVVLDCMRQVLITSAGNDSANTFVITGTDYNGNTLSESILGANAGAVTSVKFYKTITSITVNAVATTVQVGTNGVAVSPAAVLDYFRDPFNATLQCIVSGTVNYTVQYTLDDIFAANYSQGGGNWFTHDTTIGVNALSAKTANAVGTLIGVVRAVRLLMNSSTPPGSVTMTVAQAGLPS